MPTDAKPQEIQNSPVFLYLKSLHENLNHAESLKGVVERQKTSLETELIEVKRQLVQLEKEEQVLNQELETPLKRAQETKEFIVKLQKSELGHSQNYPLSLQEFQSLSEQALLTEELPSPQDLSQIKAVLDKEKTRHSDRLVKKNKAVDESCSRLQSILLMLQTRPEGERSIPFQRLLQISNQDMPFLEELKPLEVPHTDTNSRTIGYYYKHQPKLKKKEYDAVMQALSAAVQNKLTAIRESRKRKTQIIQNKIEELNRIEKVAQGINDIDKNKLKIASLLPEELKRSQALEQVIAIKQESLAAIKLRQRDLLAKSTHQPLMIEYLQQMDSILAQDIQVLGTQSLNLTKSPNWKAWQDFGKKYARLQEQCKTAGIEDYDSPFTNLEKTYASIEEKLERHFFSSLETSFAYYDALSEKVQRLSSFQTADDFDAFQLEYSKLVQELEEIQKQTLACIELFKAPLENASQTRFNTFKERLATAELAKEEYALEGSRRLTSLIKKFRQDIRQLNLKSTESVQSFNTARNNLDKFYATPYSLFDCLSLSNHSLLRFDFLYGIEDYKELLALYDAQRARKTFVDGLIEKYAISDASLLIELDSYPLSRSNTKLLDCIEDKLLQADEPMAMNLNKLIVDLTEYPRQFIETHIKRESFEYSCYSFAIGMPEEFLKPFEQKDPIYYQNIRRLYAKVDKMKAHAGKLDKEYRSFDADYFRNLANKFQDDLDYFVMEHRENAPKAAAYRALQRVILARIHSSEETRLGEHVEKYKPILANIAIGVFSICLGFLFKGIHARVTTGKWSFFYFDKTQRQELLNSLEKSTKSITIVADPEPSVSNNEL